MPTVRRLDWTWAGRGGLVSGVVVGVVAEELLVEEEVLLKKAVIWRWAGSLAAPAKGRLVLGPADIAVLGRL